jgi:hypothetical protein
MADERILVVNALLCFAFHCFRKHPMKILKSILLDYFDEITITVAKERLLADIDNLNVNNWKCPAKRRGENKTKQEIEDILSVIAFVDENNALLQLPRYVVENLDDVPMMRMEKGELAILISKLDKIDESISSMQMNSHLHSNQDRCNVQAVGTNGVSSRVSNSQPINQPSILRDSSTTVQAGHSTYPSMVTAVHDMELDNDRSTTDYRTDYGHAADDNWRMAASRKKRRISARQSPVNRCESHPSQGPSTSRLWSDRVAAPSTAQYTPRTVPKVAPKKLRIIGRAAQASDSSTKLKAAKPFVKKIIYGV